jgi:hypothetical protein
MIDAMVSSSDGVAVAASASKFPEGGPTRHQATLLGGATATWPLVARAQQARMPVIGFLSSLSVLVTSKRISSFGQGLSETGSAATSRSKRLVLLANPHHATTGHRTAGRSIVARWCDGEMFGSVEYECPLRLQLLPN